MMKIRTLVPLSLAGAIMFAPVAFAAGLDGLQYEKEMTMTMKSGKTVTVKIGKMDGHTMAIIPADELNELLMRAEGHSMATDD